jgi:hypothetical protein
VFWRDSWFFSQQSDIIALLVHFVCLNGEKSRAGYDYAQLHLLHILEDSTNLSYTHDLYDSIEGDSTKFRILLMLIRKRWIEIQLL